VATGIKLFDPARVAHTQHTSYVYSDAVVTAINLALAVGRPLLVSGPPGSGRATLARNVAMVLAWRYLEHRLSARTRPQDLLWTSDEMRRLSDAQVGKLGDAAQYIRPGVLWEAFTYRATIWMRTARQSG
jgi:MoxR-like ATPase